MASFLPNTSPLTHLTAQLKRLPGLGERSASRLAFYIARQTQNQSSHASSLARDLAKALIDVADHVVLCPVCQNLCTGDQCEICKDRGRDDSMLCVVEHVQDLHAVEATVAFRGLYHVLHGAIAPLDGIGPHDLHIPELMTRLKQNCIEEVIVATNTNVEGDATALYLSQIIKPLGIKVTRLASGIPLGGELEYLDQATLGRALNERREF